MTSKSVLILVTALTCACGSSATTFRPTTADNARSDDEWLLGERCTGLTPAEPSPRFEILAEGSGPRIEPGMTVRVHYVASLPSGKVIHDSHDFSNPSELILGSTKTICGFERALVGMHAGEQRRILVPSALAFGEAGRPPEIPPNTDLTFVVDMFLPADFAAEEHSPAPNPVGGGRRGGGGGGPGGGGGGGGPPR